MDDLKVYTRQIIAEEPLPVIVEEFNPISSSQPSQGDFVSRAKISNQEFPAPKFATEVLSQAINTKSRKILQQFEFTKSGALQIGEYVNGVTGDIKISPDGIVARNKSGVNTIAADGDTGDVTVQGTIRASTFESNNLLTGLIDVGTPGNTRYVRIDGANNRILINDGSNDRVLIGYQSGGF